MLLQDIIYDIRKEKSEAIVEFQYEKAATMRDLEVTLLQNFAKVIDFTKNDVEKKDEYLDRVLDEIVKYNIELIDDEPYNICINYNNTEYIKRFFKLKMLCL